MIPGIALFVFKNKVNKNGEVKIYIRFTNNRKCSYVCTNILIPIKYWDKKRQRVKPSFEQANAINMLLERKMSEMREQLMIKAMNTRHITSKQAKTLGIKKGDLSFFALADSFVDQLIKSGKIGTADKVKSILFKFQKYLGGRSVTFYDIDESVLTDYQAYLRDELNNSVNTIHTNLKTIRRIFSIAVEKNIIGLENDSSKRIKLKAEKAIRPFLSEDEIRRLIDLKLELGSELEKARDVFVWTIFSGGMRISDVLLLRKSNIEGDYIVNRIKKTGTPHRIKMPEYANQLLQKYLSRINGFDGYVFQMIPDHLIESDSEALDKALCLATSIYNKNLKRLSKLAKIDKKVSSHIARISFITMAVSSGVDMTTVQGIAGHSDLEMTAHYSKYVDNQAFKALEKLEQQIVREKIS
jgi:integrase/recombinase XerD